MPNASRNHCGAGARLGAAKLEAAQVDHLDRRIKKGLCARKDHTGRCYGYPNRNSACARSTRPLSGLGISTVHPRSRDLAISLFHSSTTLTLPSTFINLFHFQTPIHKDSHSNLRISRFSPDISKMPPKAAEKKPSTGGKAPAGKAPADKKEAGKKTAAAPSGEKKKRGKTRKETYSSYIYKGMFLTGASR